MIIYHGQSLAPGVAIAAAARLEETFGVPQLAPERQRRMGETLLKARLDLPDPDQIIIVARRLPPGFLQRSFPGLQVIGAALGDDLPLSPLPTCPVVAGTGDDLMAEVSEGDIVIVDGDRGRIYVAPDAQTLARYQGPVRRARRFFLEAVHVEARRGGSGPAIPVLAAAADWDDVREAMAAGADGVLIPQDGAIWADNDFLSASEQLLRLRDLGDIMGGKTLFLQVPLERVALSALAQAAAWGPVHLVVDSLALAGEARAELDGLETELDAEDIAYGRVVLDALPDTNDTPSSEALSFVDGLLLVSLSDAPKTAPGEEALTLQPPRGPSVSADAEAGKEEPDILSPDLRLLCTGKPGGTGENDAERRANASLPAPVPLSLTALVSDPDEVRALLDRGVTRLLCSIARIQAVKDAVRRS